MLWQSRGLAVLVPSQHYANATHSKTVACASVPELDRRRVSLGPEAISITFALLAALANGTAMQTISSTSRQPCGNTAPLLQTSYTQHTDTMLGQSSAASSHRSTRNATYRIPPVKQSNKTPASPGSTYCKHSCWLA
jgi:hypothetical protein